MLMDTISMDRIRKRITSLTSSEVKKFNLNPVTVFEQAMQSCSDSILENAIYNWEGLSPNKNIAFVQVMQLFDKICENGNVGLIKKTCNFICEEVVNKVNDTNKMHSYIDKKMKERDTHSNSFVDRKIQQAKDVKDTAVSVATAAKDNFKKNTSQIKQNIDKGLGRDKDKDKNKKNEVKKESYQNILDTIDMYSHCDRVLENYNKLSKRFNIDKLIEDYSNLSVSTIVYEICSLIDTYRIPFKAKYNIALETAFYSMKKHSIQCELSELAKATTDYFLINYPADLEGDSLSEKCTNTINTMRCVLEKNNFYDKKIDLDKLDFIFNKTEKNGSERNIRPRLSFLLTSFSYLLISLLEVSWTVLPNDISLKKSSR